MKVYVQGEKSLIPIQEEVTAESIEEALGYVPADAEDIIECIEESDDSALYVTDKDGNIITRTDGDGFHASVMTVNGKDVESGLVTDEDRESWGGSDLDDVISKDDDSTLSVTDKDGNIIAKIDKDGLHATEVYIGNETVADMIAALVGAAPETLNTLEELATAFKEHEEVAAALDEAITNKADATEFETHKADYEAHKTDYESHKSAFATHKAEFDSHKGDSTHLGEEIKLDDDTALYIVDKDGNIIARVDGDGLDVTDLKVSSQPIDEYLNDILGNGGSACSHEYVTIQELIRNTTDCTTWKDLQYCSSCGKVHANRLHKDHDWDTEVVVTPPTCTDPGYTTHYCNNCDETYVDAHINALGHTESDWIIDVEPTFSTPGSKHTVCTVCGETVRAETIPTTGEESDGILTYRVLDDGTLSVRATDTATTPSEVVIPSTYNGKTVTQISDYAFSGCSSTTKITIPNSVTYIGQYAFNRCSMLETILIPSSVTTVGQYAFNYAGSDTIYGTYIYCEAASRPSGWSTIWYESGTVMWNYPSTGYAITYKLTNCAGAGSDASYVKWDDNALKMVAASSGYSLPYDDGSGYFSVTNCDYTWNQSTGRLHMFKPEGAVTVTITARSVSGG